MNLTGQCKKDFDKWYCSHKQPNGHWYAIKNFYQLVDSMKYGLYVDFAIEVGYEIFVIRWRNKWVENVFEIKEDNSITVGIHEARKGLASHKDARVRAIQKFNEIYNEQNNY